MQKRGFLSSKTVPFDSIYSFRYVEREFGSIYSNANWWCYSYDSDGNMTKPNADFLSFTFGTIPIFGLGLGLSFLPQFSEELIVGDNGVVYLKIN